MRSSVVKKLKICGRGEELKFSGGRKKRGGSETGNHSYHSLSEYL